MRRRLFTLCSALSLLLCVTACVLWARSYWVMDAAWTGPSSDGETRFMSANGKLFFRRFRVFPTSGAARWWMTSSHSARTTVARQYLSSLEPLRPRWWERVGFRVENNSVQMVVFRADFLTVDAPYSAFALATAALPAAFVAGLVRRTRRANAGLCPACGYDLRATPGRCPECGAEPKGTTA